MVICDLLSDQFSSINRSGTFLRKLFLYLSKKTSFGTYVRTYVGTTYINTVYFLLQRTIAFSTSSLRSENGVLPLAHNIPTYDTPQTLLGADEVVTNV